MIDGRGAATVLLACSLLFVALAPAPAAAEEVRIDEASFEDDAVVVTRGGTAFLWESAPVRLSVDVVTAPREGQGHYEVCVASRSANGSRELACRSTVLSGDERRTLTFDFESWPAGTGPQSVEVVLTADTLSNQVAAATTLQIHVLSRTGDLDGDGLTNEREIGGDTNFTRADTDGDGLDDGLELRPYETNPRGTDTDGDGLTDGAEVHDHDTDPAAGDTDGDGLGDAVELGTHGTNPRVADTDGDSLGDAVEVNTHGTDPTAADTDGDGLDDGLEVNTHGTNPAAADTDDDSLADPLEVLTYGTDPNKVDTDGDGLTDGAEVAEYGTDPTAGDTDGDGLDDGTEASTHGTDPTATDTDGDGLPDGEEVTAHGTDPTAADTDGDGIGDRSEVDPGPAVPPAFLVGLVSAVVVLAAGGAWIARSGHPLAGRARATLASARGAPEPEPRASPEPDAPAPATAEPSPPLTNEDRVLRLLEERGGRIEQSAIVEATDWSKATVSRVLSRMEEDGQITKIDVGRENVITLPEAAPERAKPPFDDADPPERASR